MKFSEDDSQKHFKMAQALFNTAMHDQADPASENLLRGINEYFYAVIALQMETGRLLTEALDRIAKLERAAGPALATKPK